MPSEDFYNAQLQDRDVALLIGLFESRLMTLAHAAAIHFQGAAEATKKRVQKLKAAGYLADRPRRARDPSILSLKRKAFTVLAEGGYLDQYPSLVWTNLEKRAHVSELTLRHELAVMDFKSSIYTAVAARQDISIAQFSTWPLLYEFTASPGEGRRPMAVRPDGYLCLRHEAPGGTLAEHLFFLEIDRSTEPLDTLVTRSLCYRNYYNHGGMAVRNGLPASEFHQFPFRVLIVLRTAERRNNLTERLLALRPPILNQVWLTTFAEAQASPLGAIWIQPLDYRAIIHSGESAQTAHTSVYRRDVRRDAIVEAQISKQPLMRT
jgi:hypothetical protein